MKSINTALLIFKYMYILFCIFLRKRNIIPCVPLATKPGISGWLADRCSVSQQLGALQTHSFSFLTQRTYSCSNFIAISSLVLELLKKCRVRYREGHTVYDIKGQTDVRKPTTRSTVKFINTSKYWKKMYHKFVE